jgi:hypothetical protein
VRTAAAFEGAPALGQRERLADHRTQPARAGQLGQLGESVGVLLHDEEHRVDVVLSRPLLVRRAGQGDQPTARAQQGVRAVERRAADRVDDDVEPVRRVVGPGDEVAFRAEILGLVFAPAFTLGTLGVDRDDAGVASATINVAQQIGGSIGTSLLNTIAATAAAGYITAHAASITSAASAAGRQLVVANSLIHSYHIVFWVAAGIYLGAAVLTGLLLRPGVVLPSGADS